MTYKFQKRYRLPEFDYSQTGGYFVTICTKNKETYFGNVVEGDMELSKVGDIAKKMWLEIPNRFEYVIIDEYVIMPNHIHGIIMITDNNFGNTLEGENSPISRNAPRRVHGMQHDSVINKNTPRRVHTGIHPLIKKSVSSIINHFKGNVKRWCNKNGFKHFSWQSRYYDRVIRNEKELTDTRQYILDNPLKWEIDKNNPENLYM